MIEIVSPIRMDNKVTGKWIKKRTSLNSHKRINICKGEGRIKDLSMNLAPISQRPRKTATIKKEAVFLIKRPLNAAWLVIDPSIPTFQVDLNRSDCVFL